MNETLELTADALEDLSDSFLLFYIDETVYGIPLKLVREIVNIHSVTLTYLPGIPDYVRGIVNLRSKVVPVIDVRRKFRLPDRAFDDKTCIIFLDVQDMNVGLIVDLVSEVVTLESNERTAPPKGGDPSTRYLESVAEVGNRVVLNIDCQKFFQSDLL